MDFESLRRVGGAGIPEFVKDIMPPDGRRFWVTDEMAAGSMTRTGEIKPKFSIGQVSKLFFARSSDWIRYLDRDEAGFNLDGNPLIPSRSDAGSRYYTLADVEKMAHALLQNGRLDLLHFAATIQIIRAMAFLYRIIPESDLIRSPGKFVAPPHEHVEGQEMIPGTEHLHAE